MTSLTQGLFYEPVMLVQPILSMQSCSDYFLLLFLCLAATSADRFYRIDRSQVNHYFVFL